MCRVVYILSINAVLGTDENSVQVLQLTLRLAYMHYACSCSYTSISTETKVAPTFALASPFALGSTHFPSWPTVVCRLEN